MHARGRQPQRAPDAGPLHYQRHRPEQTPLCRLVQQHVASFIAHTEASTGAELTRLIKDGFDAFLERGILAHGFLRLRGGSAANLDSHLRCLVLDGVHRCWCARGAASRRGARCSALRLLGPGTTAAACSRTNAPGP